ncbi:hypothetical protein [Olleya sp. HaHaR_3_96]|uniref:hypothetical protein n=1 Tax=Olleya sp. HaHaR_3_96 TaxID=2745560 RepID=UPI001C4E7398|nr:hypothetical protein [Olleya sp. HaHaR_3_96]QXP58418.1 hypothetical protein H0I26_10850 [Olleya sp. HaHaR_3_96]
MKKIVLMLSFVSLVIGCKNDKTLKDNLKLDNKNMFDTKRSTYFDFYFQDTVHVNKTYRGVIAYKSYLDTITPLQIDGKSSRLTVFYVNHNTEQIMDSYNHIIKDPKSLLFSSDLRDSIYFEYSFKQTGRYFLEGVLENEVLFETGDYEEPIETVTNYNHVTFPVFVTDDENIVDTLGSVVRSDENERGVTYYYEKKGDTTN